MKLIHREFASTSSNALTILSLREGSDAGLGGSFRNDPPRAGNRLSWPPWSATQISPSRSWNSAETSSPLRLCGSPELLR